MRVEFIQPDSVQVESVLTQAVQTRKPRVAFLVSRFPVLSQTFVINQATGLIDRGYDVDIFTERLEEAGAVHPDVVKYDLLSRTYVMPSVPQSYIVRSLKAVSLLLRYAPFHLKRIFQSLDVSQLGIRAASLWALFTAIPTLNLPHYDIVHCQFGDLSFRGLLLRDLMRLRAQEEGRSRQQKNAGDKRGLTKLIVMFRGFDISARLKAEGEDIYASVFDQADFFLTNCDFFRQRLLSLGAPPERTRVHYSGLNCDKFEFQSRRLVPGETVRIAATGRLVEKKGLAYCIRGVAKLTERYPTVRLDIVGDGPLRAELEALIESLQIGEKVHLLGWRDEAGLIEVLSQAHLFVAPSVTAANGNQDAPINVLKEAMAMGLPVVSTWHGGIPELVKDGVSGYLVPERDEDAIALALAKLIEQPERWPEMGKAGRAYVERYYSLDDLNNRLAALYEMLSSSSGDLASKERSDVQVKDPPIEDLSFPGYVSNY